MGKNDPGGLKAVANKMKVRPVVDAGSASYVSHRHSHLCSPRGCSVCAGIARRVAFWACAALRGRSKGATRPKRWLTRLPLARAQVCEKQCRDENGFKCHTTSESHLRQVRRTLPPSHHLRPFVALRMLPLSSFSHVCARCPSSDKIPTASSTTTARSLSDASWSTWH